MRWWVVFGSFGNYQGPQTEALGELPVVRVKYGDLPSPEAVPPSHSENFWTRSVLFDMWVLVWLLLHPGIGGCSSSLVYVGRHAPNSAGQEEHVNFMVEAQEVYLSVCARQVFVGAIGLKQQVRDNASEEDEADLNDRNDALDRCLRLRKGYGKGKR